MAEEGLNRVVLLGRLGQDPELRYTQGGQPILNMRMATTESFVNRDKERQERTEWHTVTMWGKRGESLNRFLSKGSKLCVEGRLQTRSWEGKDGGKRYSTEVVATNILLLGGKGESRGGSHEDGSQPKDDDYASSASYGGGGGGGAPGFDDDIPFAAAEKWAW